MALTAVQAFGVRVNLPANPGAVIATLGAVAFLLYTYSLRRADLTQRPDSPAPAWINLLISLAAGGILACFVWTATTINLTKPTMPAVTPTFVATTGAFVLAMVLTWIWLRRRRRTW